MHPLSPAIVVTDLRKEYGDLRAVAGVSFHVDPGEIFGVLGPNGAGKTTMLETMIGMRQPTAGTATVLNLNPYTQRQEMACHVSIQPQRAALFDHLTVLETLELFASFYPSSKAPLQLMCDLGLEEKQSTLVKKLSGGQRQRLLLAVALIGNTDVLFLDEPTSSLDPQARRQLWDVIRARRDEGKTVVLTTHSMEEAQALCDRLAIMNKGAILATGTAIELINQVLPEQLVVYETSMRPDVVALQALPGVINVLVGPIGSKHSVRIRTSEPHRTLRTLLADNSLPPNGGFRVEQGTLEDVFLALVNRGAEEGGADDWAGDGFSHGARI